MIDNIYSAMYGQYGYGAPAPGQAPPGQGPPGQAPAQGQPPQGHMMYGQPGAPNPYAQAPGMPQAQQVRVIYIHITIGMFSTQSSIIIISFFVN